MAEENETTESSVDAELSADDLEQVSGGDSRGVSIKKQSLPGKH